MFADFLPHSLTDVTPEVRDSGYRLVNSEAENMVSVRFFKTTRHLKTLGHLDYFR